METKIQYKIDGQNHPRGDKKGRPKKGQNTHSSKDPKRGKELVILMVGSYFTQSPL
jgi:hypothetical protein